MLGNSDVYHYALVPEEWEFCMECAGATNYEELACYHTYNGETITHHTWCERHAETIFRDSEWAMVYPSPIEVEHDCSQDYCDICDSQNE